MPVLPTAIFWFRRDLRLEDNHALFRALSSESTVQPVFIFDSTILTRLDDPADARVTFIYEQLQLLQKQLKPYGSSIRIYYGDPATVWKEIYEEYKPSSVYVNSDYEPAAITRDLLIRGILQQYEVDFNTFKDQVIFEKAEIVKNDGLPYTVYTPYKNKWLTTLEEQLPLPSYSSEQLLNNLRQADYTLPSLADFGFSLSTIPFPEKTFFTGIADYADTRDIPGLENGTSHLGVHLRFGTISIRKLVSRAYSSPEKTYLYELIWREFFMMCLWHFPHTVNQAYYSKYDHIRWENNTDHFEAWCKGQTGYPLVDAGMRELNTTGFMHNRVRMLTASFLCKHLLIDWRWGEAYFAQKLLDYDQSANIGNWQWAAGCGMDAAPYFRIFNPTLQTKKFDPQFIYIKKWVPEFQDFNYPSPIVEHTWARDRALTRYKAGFQLS
ncbi:cryptochrome/photolyase family protein [Sphingobacterium spiritivorum]|uniref:cryptochrome/photolyase family protein n=1 Tax=Sphingobacterium spiritivorum TaxID=258 RepID=UPI0019188528|nr:deoxyribodipyrimidine photo-lyase [Sphingobacterium spiritivorum]QQT24344.1 deoxyribodipyrimidine photo-lyase [Sphingobacterium spiritivorum]